MSTTSSVHPHHHISRIFLSLPVDVASLPPLPASQRRYRAPTNQSELHLGLGRFTAYDGSAQPGPSPPTSPAPSPTKRNFTHDSENRNVRPKYPASPLTPSRASRKAAELLGVNANTAVPRPTKKKEHFRPLPHQKLIEIDRFFGNVKPKPSKKHPGLKSNPRQATSQAKDGRVGEGETVPHKGDDGSMWLDVEEEQEFAWLMSEIFAAVPPPLPPLADGGELLWEERSDDEDQWGMEAFTSVLSLPKPKSDMNRRKGESFIELGTPAPRRVPRPEMASHPRSNPIPSTSRVTTPPSMSAPLLIPPPRTSSRDPSPSDSDSTSSSRQPKHRPPPLALPTSPPKSKRLPQLTATTPDRPKTKRATTEQPTTPFVKPRTAPRPAPSSEPIPAVPKLLPPLAITSMPEPRQEMSFFDPVTPIAQESRGRLGDWFSKVVNGVRF